MYTKPRVAVTVCRHTRCGTFVNIIIILSHNSRVSIVNDFVGAAVGWVKNRISNTFWTPNKRPFAPGRLVGA